MRIIRSGLIAIFGLAMVLFALANRTPVTIKLLPPEFEGVRGLEISHQVPLFIVMFGGVLAGLIAGYVLEWIREAKERAIAAKQAQELKDLREEVVRLKSKIYEGKDEILALVEETG